MPVDAPLDPNDPLLVAFNRYAASDDGLNSLHWVTFSDTHAKGALWGAYRSGWYARGERNARILVDILRRTRDSVQLDLNLHFRSEETRKELEDLLRDIDCLIKSSE